MPKNNKPVYEVRIYPVKVAVWRNETKENSAFYSTTVERSYKDGDEYKSTTSFNRDDLLKLSKAVDIAHTWIIRQEAKERQTTSGEE